VFTAALVLLGTLGGCNYRWKAYQSTFQFKRLDFVSSMPAHKEADGTYTRQCVADPARPADSLLLSFSFIGTEPQTDTVTEDMKDKDFSIRPGDLVKNPDNGYRDIIELSTGEGTGTIFEADFEVEISCLEPYPDPDIDSLSRVCSPGKSQSITSVPEKLDYAGNFPEGAIRASVEDRTAVSMAIMIDQSGSMKGFIEPETFVEVSANSRVNRSGFANRASDSPGFRRDVAQTLIKQLNYNDRAGVFQFGEAVSLDRAKILCAGDNESEDDARLACFGINRALIDPEALKSLQSDADGRTPLWQSVKDVYDFMKENGGTRVKHIVVITDGPDTCHPDSPDYQSTVRYLKSNGTYALEEQSSCSTVSYKAFFDSIKADVMNEDGSPKAIAEIPVHVSFIQIQARGYKNIDPLQQELACLTGGHFIFINAVNLPPSNQVVTGTHPLQTALSDAIYKLRYAISGVWTVTQDVPDLANGILTPGSVTAVEGHIRTAPDVDNEIQRIIPTSFRADMKVGLDNGAFSIDMLDTRGNFRIPSYDAGTDCSWIPDSEIIETCETAATSLVNGVCRVSNAAFGTVCGTGTCCYGMCYEAAAECLLPIDELCNSAKADDDTVCTGGTCKNGVCVATAG
jgi:hypothetical protein